MSEQTIETISAGLKDLIKERLDIDHETIGVNDDSPLFDENAWGIDSVDVLDIVLGIEERYGVKIRQDDSSKAAFGSIRSLATHIEQIRSRS